MRTHSLKTWPEPWHAVRSGAKTFEVRRDDRGFAVGDELLLRLFDPSESKQMSGGFVLVEGVSHFGKTWEEAAQTIRCAVTYVLPGGRFGLDAQWCVLGIKVIE